MKRSRLSPGCIVFLAIFFILIAISFFIKGGYPANSTGSGQSPPAKSDAAQNKQILQEQNLIDEKNAIDQFSGAEHALKTKNRESMELALDRLKKMKELINPEIRRRRENLIKMIEQTLLTNK